MKNLIPKLILPILIILTSLIYGLPHILLISRLGANYTPFILTGSPIARDEAFAYAPFVNHILKGHLFLKDVYVAEYTNFPTPYLGETAPSIVFAILARLTGSIEKAFIVGDFIFPPIIFLLLYKLSSLFIKHKLFAASTAFLTVVARDFIAVIPYPHETFQYLTFAEGQNYLLFFSRAFHPQLTFIFFILAILLTIKLLKNPSNKLTTLALGLIFGVLFYTYVFYWTYFLLVFLFVITYSFIKKDRATTRALILSGAIAFIIGSFYIYNSWQFSQLGIASDFITKTSLHNLPLPLTLLRYLAIILIFLGIFRLKNHESQVVFFVLLAGITISPLSKLVIGQDLETFHYLRRALMPIATVSFFAIVYYFISKRRLLLIIGSTLIFSASLFLALRTQLIAAEKIQAVHSRDRTQQAVFNWLETNTHPGSVVGSLDTVFNSLLPTYTKNYVYFPPTDRTIMTTDEGVDRFLITSNLLGLSLEEQKMMLSDKSLLSYLFVYQAYENSKLSVDSIKGKSAQNRAQDLYGLKWQERAKDFRMDYLVVAPNELAIIKPDMRFLSPITSINQYLIFKYKK